MIQYIWLAMIFGSILWGAATDRLDAVANVLLENANAAATIAMGLIGIMTFWLGVMKVVEVSGFSQTLARLCTPFFRRLFPEIPANHPVFTTMMMNITANLLGLGNAATPFGLRAMEQLQQLNRHPGVASNAMITFLVINTSGLALIPTGMMALRSSLGSKTAADIVLPTLLASMVGLLIGLVLALVLGRLFPVPASAALPPTMAQEVASSDLTKPPVQEPGQPLGGSFWLLLLSLVLAFGIGFGRSLARHKYDWLLAGKDVALHWPILLLFVGVLLVGVARRVPIYEVVVDGGKEGFQTILRVLPYLVAMMVAIGMVRASGLLDACLLIFQPLLQVLGMPVEVAPMVLMRPISGQGAYGLAAELMQQKGPDSLLGRMIATMNGSSETTFYVLSLYYGVARIKHIRYTMWVCLAAECTAMLVAVWACRWL